MQMQLSGNLQCRIEPLRNLSVIEYRRSRTDRDGCRPLQLLARQCDGSIRVEALREGIVYVEVAGQFLGQQSRC